tara:strand:+ start:1613 stop:2305 length:693 start_codon:yes stop_codon:yes gene_type:complete
LLVHAIIPARAGSKGVINKNLMPVKGIPLFQRSISHAVSLNKYHETKIWISTNIEQILSFESEEKNLHIHRRPENLCGDKVLTVDVISDIINTYNFPSQDIILLLQPTSPFRCISEISNSIDLLKKDRQWKSFVSLSEVEGYHPFRMKRMTNNGECINFIDQGFEDMRPRQILPKVYIRSGNFYITKVNYLLENMSLVIHPCKGVVHKDSNLSINIDKYIDLEIANSCNY